jgi:NAD(P)-dependent dehydrogenase (short-subunit alcohol dehydrogenase family)
MNRRLDDEVVLVTGAARGPGRADCIAGGAPGGRVVAGDLAGGDGPSSIRPPTKHASSPPGPPMVDGGAVAT